MLTAIEDEHTQVASFDGNADDYITKPFSMVLLGRRITALLRRSGQTQPLDIMTFGDVTVSFSGYTASGPEGKIDITPKEIDLLRLLVEHKGLVLTRSQILDELWGDDYPIIDRKREKSSFIRRHELADFLFRKRVRGTNSKGFARMEGSNFSSHPHFSTRKTNQKGLQKATNINGKARNY